MSDNSTNVNPPTVVTDVTGTPAVEDPVPTSTLEAIGGPEIAPTPVPTVTDAVPQAGATETPNAVESPIPAVTPPVATETPVSVPSAVPEVTDTVPPPVATEAPSAVPSPIPEVPDTVPPEVVTPPVGIPTDLPNIRDVAVPTDIPGVPAIPNIPEVIVPPTIPVVVVPPSIPEVVVPPTIPGVVVPPSIPVAPALPTLPVVPGLPTLPDVLVPPVPALPTLPDVLVPPVPALPTLPDVLVPPVPALPTLPDVPAPPGTPDVDATPATPDVTDGSGGVPATPDVSPTTDPNSTPPVPESTPEPTAAPTNPDALPFGNEINNKVVTNSPDGTENGGAVITVPNADPSSIANGGAVNGLPELPGSNGTEPSVSESAENASASDNPNTGIIIGVVCGIVFISLAIAALIMYRRRRASRRRGVGSGQIEEGNSTFDVLIVRSMNRVDDSGTDDPASLETNVVQGDRESFPTSRGAPTLSLSISNETLLPDLEFPEFFTPATRPRSPKILKSPTTDDAGFAY